MATKTSKKTQTKAVGSEKNSAKTAAAPFSAGGSPAALLGVTTSVTKVKVLAINF